MCTISRFYSIEAKGDTKFLLNMIKCIFQVPCRLIFIEANMVADKLAAYGQEINHLATIVF